MPGLGADGKYRHWSRSRGENVPASIVMPWIMELAAMSAEGTSTEVALTAGVNQDVVRKVRRGTKKSVSFDTAERLAFAATSQAELSRKMLPGGCDDWSHAGRYCGDTTARVEGCGTWFHAHFAHGLCEECFGREMFESGPAEPRDVRACREVGAYA